MAKTAARNDMILRWHQPPVEKEEQIHPNFLIQKD